MTRPGAFGGPVMEFRQLRYFVRIVDLGSLSKAAADLYVAQPALSKQVAALEAELKNGLLAIDLDRPEPQKLVQKINISVKD